jgi:hypothetical protein
VRAGEVDGGVKRGGVRSWMGHGGLKGRGCEDRGREEGA